MSQPDTLVWLASHELRLGWRDWIAMMTAGRRNRARNLAIALIIFAGFMHLLAYSMVGRYAGARIGPDKATLIVVTGIMLLSWSLLLSQAIELVTRVFYSRSDLDLILTSPVSPQKIFSVRIGRIAVEVALFAMLAGDAFHQRAGGSRRRSLALRLWRGRRHGRGGDGFCRGAHRGAVPHHRRQAHAAHRADRGGGDRRGLRYWAADRGDLSYGSLSLAPLQSAWLIAHVPHIDSPVWWPARAMLGEPTELMLVLAISITLLGAVMLIFAARFGDHVVAAAGVSQAVVRQRRWSKAFRRHSASRMLRQKEWILLARDPWLMSQTLMQILYLLPPALFLWHSFHSRTDDAYILLVPMMVMAAGHLGGNLAWLSISGEDAPDLVATAPISAQRIIWAKIEAVMGAVAFIFAPLVVALAFASVRPALVAGVGVLIAAASAMLIQLCFRTQARRSQFRHRHVSSSRIATFAEAVTSIAWAADLGAGRGRYLARADPGAHCHQHSRRRPAEQPAGYSGIRRAIALARQTAQRASGVNCVPARVSSQA